EKVRAARNKLAKEHAPGTEEEGRKLKEGLKVLEEELSTISADWQNVMDWMPNVVSPLMPIGETSKDNLEIKSWPTKNPRPKFDFDPKHYHDLMVNLGLVDMEKAAKNSGSRFYYLKNEAVLLQFALFSDVLQKLVAKGFTPIITPDLVKY